MPSLSNISTWTGRTALSAGLLLLAIGVALGCKHTLSAAWEQVYGLFQHGSHVGAALTILALAAVCTGAWWTIIHTGTRARPFPAPVFVVMVMLASLAVHILLAVYVQPRWGTDYLRYWQHAKELVREGKYGGFNAPYYSRALFVPYSVVRLFGPDATFALKLTNIALLSLVQLCSYDILRRVRSLQAAQVGLLVLVLAPIPAFATLIPSHDLWGLFFIAVSAWLFTLAIRPMASGPREWLVRTTLALLAGLVAYMAQIQRGTGTVFLLAVVLIALLSWMDPISRNGRETSRRGMPAKVLGVALLGLVGMLASGLIGRHAGLEPQGRTTLVMMKIAANSGGLGSGTSDWYARFRDRFGEEQGSPLEAKDFAKSMGLSSWALQPLARLDHMAHQAARLFGAGYPMDWDWLLRHPEGMSEHTRSLFILYADLFGIGFALAFGFALFRLATRDAAVPVPVGFMQVTVLALALLLLTLFENKPFNIFPFWMAGSLAIATVLPDLRGSGWLSGTLTRHAFSRAAIAGAFTIAVLVVSIAGIRACYGIGDGRLISDWSFTAQQSIPPTDPDWGQKLLHARPAAFDPLAFDPSRLGKSYIQHAKGDGDRIRAYGGDTVTTLAFPARVTAGDRVEARARVCATKQNRRALEFFLYAPPAQGKKLKYRLLVAVDDRLVRKIALPLKGRPFQHFQLPGAMAEGHCSILSYRLEASGQPDKSAAGMHGPSLEIWMPRLVR